MQKAINEKIVGAENQQADEVNIEMDRINVFFKFVPSLEEFQNNGMECEDTYKTCKLF